MSFKRFLASSVRLGCLAFALGFILLMASGSVRSTAQLAFIRAIAAVHRPTLVVIGDSIIRNCPWNELFSPFSVVNLAQGGAVTRQIVSQASAANLMGARIVLVIGGTNDLLLDRAPVSHIAFDFEILMRTLAPVPRRIVTLLPYTRMPELNREHDKAKAVILRLAQLHQAEVIDLDALVSKDGILRAEMTTDGVHLSAQACDAWIEAVRKMLRLESGS